MPQKKRARKNDPVEVSVTTSEDTVVFQATEPTKQGLGKVNSKANSGPIFELPTEVWLEILSYLPSVRIPTLRISNTPLLPTFTLARQHTLRALSQTCRLFRERFLPELWDRLEVCATPAQKENLYSGVSDNSDNMLGENIYLSGAWYKAIALSLKTKSNGLCKSPEHAKLVRKASVILTRCSAASVLEAFARCLHALPNCHTLQILRAHTQMTTHLKNAFKGHKFPQIRTIVLPSHAHNVLRSCPEVRTVLCIFGDGSKLVSAIAKECKKVTRLQGFRPDEKLMKRSKTLVILKVHNSNGCDPGIVKAAPNLEEISFGCPVNAKILGLLSSLKKIRSIELLAHCRQSPDKITDDQELMTCIRSARDILRKSPQKPSLVVRQWGEEYSESWTKELEVHNSV